MDKDTIIQQNEQQITAHQTLIDQTNEQLLELKEERDFLTNQTLVAITSGLTTYLQEVSSSVDGADSLVFDSTYGTDNLTDFAILSSDGTTVLYGHPEGSYDEGLFYPHPDIEEAFINERVDDFKVIYDRLNNYIDADPIGINTQISIIEDGIEGGKSNLERFNDQIQGREATNQVLSKY